MAPASWWFAAMLVVAELVTAAVGADSLGFAAAGLLAPGLALSGLLPGAMRRHPVARWAAAPSLGLAVSSIAIISVAKLGIPLTGASVRVVVVALVLAGLLVKRDPEPVPLDRSHLLDVAALGAVLGLAWLLAWQVIGTLPVPGDDWAKYLLYADEIRRHGSLLLENPLWMGGRPFSEDPGVPSLEGAALIMTGAPAGALVRVILFLMLAQVAATFAVARVHLGLVGAVVAAALLAIVPATQNILGWHGLANVGALAILALVLGQLGSWLAGDFDKRAELGLALTLVGVAAAHRLTAAFMVGTLGFVLLLALLFGPRRPLLLATVRTLAMAILVGFVVVLDLQVRAGDSGGTLPYTSYLNTKVDLSLALRDLSPVLALVAVLSVLVLGARRRLPRAVWPALGLVCVSVVLTYAWVLHLPLYYSRTVFFMPLGLAMLAGAGAAALMPWLRERIGTVRAGGAYVVAVAIAAVMVVISWGQADKVQDYYGFASVEALQGLDQVAAELEPNEIVATDRCWSFLATWLLHTRTYPALEEQDIQPKAELVVARKAAAILRGTVEGRELMRSTPVRWALLDPTCPVNGAEFLPPGQIRFASKRLAIIQLDPAGQARKFYVPPTKAEVEAREQREDAPENALP